MNSSTIQLYNQDSHLQSFTGTVLTCEPQDITNSSVETVYVVTLNATAFFPEGGGQPSDVGTLDSIPVLDVQEKENLIYHTISTPLTIGKVVTGVIDWTKRFDLMQHHSAEHIVSGLVHKYYGYDNVGFHMGNEAITIDFNGPLNEKDIRKIELDANLAVYQNLPIQVSYPSADELQELDYRSKKELLGNIRIVTIPGYDVCACCAPHVTLTGEIGSIKLVSFEKYKGGVRVSMLCGTRALQDYNIKEKSVAEISVLLSTKPDIIQEAVKSLKEETSLLKSQITELKHQILFYKAESIPEHTTSICLFDSTIEPNFLRAYCNLLIKHCSGFCAVFSGSDETGYKYVLASKTYDIRYIGNQLNEEFDGKGGGSKEMVQGSVIGKKESIEVFIDKLRESI